MASSGGASLLLCALFFLSTARAAGSCPPISQFSCKGNTVDFKGLKPCGNNHLRCRDYTMDHSCRNFTMEIQFGGIGQWYRVVSGEPVFHGNGLEIEDPFLSSAFTPTDCDFLYSFPSPGPSFIPPQTSAISLTNLHISCRTESDYTVLFSELIKRHQQPGPCTAYDLYSTSKEVLDSQNALLPRICLPGPDHPVFIWHLWMNNSSDGAFNVVSAGFSRRHQLFRSCFNKQKINTCGTEHQDLKRNLITGFSTAAGLSILASLLFYLRRRHKKMKTPSPSTLLSQTASTELSKKDPEEASITYPTHLFRYEELHEATNGFSPSNELDHGGHGVVYKGTLTDGRTVAIKRLYENSCNRIEQFMNEIDILSCLRHPNLVALYGCTSRHSRELLLVYEFIPNGTIADHVHGHRAAEGALVWPLRLRIAVETATALAYLHAIKPQIVHRDIKTNNILLDMDFHVKVADFGLSRLFPMAATHVSTVPQGTPGYVDPEYHRCYQLTDKSDVYSFGVVLAELISSKPAVDVTRNQNEINLSNMALNKIQNAALQEFVDPKLGFATDWEVRRSIEMVAELTMRCLQGEGDLRPTMEDVLAMLQGVAADGLQGAEKGGVVEQMVGDDMGLLKNWALASPDSVMGKWPSRTTTPTTSG